MLRALARVDLGAIERNARTLAAVAGPAALCAVVKGDGYGHGMVPAARAARAGGASWLAVATAEEARGLREGGLDGPVLVMGALSEEELAVAVAARADVVAWRVAFVERLAALPGAAGTAVHVKLDTGMGRLGTRDAGEATLVAEAVAARGELRLAGRDDPLRHRRRRPGLPRRAARGSSRRGRARSRRPTPRSSSTPPTPPPRCASPPPTSTSCAAGSPSTAWTRSRRTRPPRGSSRR